MRPFPSPEQDDLAPTPALDQPHSRHPSPRSSQDEEESQEENGLDEELKQRGGKRRPQDESNEISNNSHRSEDNLHSHDSGDEDDEDPRPTKRRRLIPANPKVARTPAREHGQKAILSRRSSRLQLR